MSRSGTGVYTLPSSVNPVVPGTDITVTWANTTLDDMATALTDSLDRAGRGSMTAALKAFAGTEVLPGLSFSNETSSGIYRPSAGLLAISILGTKVAEFNADGLAVIGTISADAGVAAGDVVIKSQLDGFASTFMKTVLDDTTAPAARATLGAAVPQLPLADPSTDLVTGLATLPTNSFTLNTGLPVGDIYTVFNNTGGTINISQGSGVTMELAGSNLTGQRVVANKGLCTIWVRATNTYVISGSGIS